MIQTFTFHTPLHHRDPQQMCVSLRRQVKRLVRFQHVLCGCTVTAEDGILVLKLRVAGISHWHISADAKRLAMLILRRSGAAWKEVTLETFITERNGHHLKLGEGRTQPTLTPRSSRQNASAPRWANVPWWGDSLEEDDSAAG